MPSTTARRPLRMTSAAMSVLVVAATVIVTITGAVALGDLLIPGAIAGAIAAILGGAGRSTRLVVAGVAAAAFPLLWFLVLVKVLGFV
ncbi:hypothetical protein [Corynebacterium sp.]|uniref:hypothetical protein n=1 Tax=Corynebacterium sp. TaxID=1720 RepID=UPI0026DB2BB6|nr:hypothetical protein [Corynebacterium sp.]MDO4609508.1 hypothetical protein [Corynebacterium sp.]